MNYPESEAIKQQIKSSDKILLNCHASPDADSVGSALSMYEVLKYWKKDVNIVCPHEIPDNLKFLQNSEKIQAIDFSKFDFQKYDLLITLDSASWNRVTGRRDLSKPDIPIIIIDHHDTNEMYGEINLVKPKMAANCELLYWVMQDMGFTPEYSEEEWKFNHDVAEDLLTGIMGDTGGLRYPEADNGTYKVAEELIGFIGKDYIIRNLFQSYSLSHVKIWASLMEKMQIDEKDKFVWSVMNFEEYKKLGHISGAKSEIADILFQSIESTDFGFVAIEEEKGFVSVSFRSRTGIDVSKMAIELGGGGHKWASAARVYNKEFSQAIDLILSTVRKLCS